MNFYVTSINRGHINLGLFTSDSKRPISENDTKISYFRVPTTLLFSLNKRNFKCTLVMQLVLCEAWVWPGTPMEFEDIEGLFALLHCSSRIDRVLVYDHLTSAKNSNSETVSSTHLHGHHAALSWSNLTLPPSPQCLTQAVPDPGCARPGCARHWHG